MIFFFNDPATTEIYTLSLHDALPIFQARRSARSGVIDPSRRSSATSTSSRHETVVFNSSRSRGKWWCGRRSEEHTSELQSQFHLVCRLLLEKKNKKSLTTSAGDTETW